MLKKASALRENLINAERRVNNQLSGCDMTPKSWTV